MRQALEVQHRFFDTTLAVGHFGSGSVTMGNALGWRWSFLGVDMGNVSAALGRLLPWLPPVWSEVEQQPLTDFHGQDLAQHTLLVQEDGAWTCALPPGWTATLDGVPLDRPEFEVHGELVLSRGDERFVARVVEAAPARDRSAPSPDVPLLVTLGTAAAAGLLFGLVTAFAPAPPQVDALTLHEQVASVRIQVPTPPPVDQPKPVEPAAAGGSGGAAGPPSPTPAPTAPRTDREIASSAGVFGSPDLISSLDGGLPGDLSSTLFTASSTRGRGPGIGSLAGRGDSLGGGGGPGGIGDIAGPGGPGTGRHAYQGDGPGKRPGAIAAVGGEPILVGTLERSEIEAVIQKSLSAIRYCYQRRLQSAPDLSGKVVVRFAIAGDGSVSSAKVASSTVGDPAVGSCVADRFTRMRFPEPRGHGVVLVTYPFLFAPG